MIVRPVDDNGDMIPITNADQMISGAAAVGQVIHQRLDVYYGEWWESDTFGLKVPDMLADNARRGDVNLLAKYIAAYISETQEVRGITNMSASLSNHRLAFRCTALTGTGEYAETEVDLSGVL